MFGLLIPVGALKMILLLKAGIALKFLTNKICYHSGSQPVGWSPLMGRGQLATGPRTPARTEEVIFKYFGEEINKSIVVINIVRLMKPFFKFDSQSLVMKVET